MQAIGQMNVLIFIHNAMNQIKQCCDVYVSCMHSNIYIYIHSAAIFMNTNIHMPNTSCFLYLCAISLIFELDILCITAIIRHFLLKLIVLTTNVDGLQLYLAPLYNQIHYS